MLSSSARRLQLAKERQHLTVRKKVRWCRAMPFQHFPKEIGIFENARISVPTTRVFGKYPRVRQICPQMEKLIFLEIWKMNWGSAKATNHCGTFIYFIDVKYVMRVLKTYFYPDPHNTQYAY